MITSTRTYLKPEFKKNVWETLGSCLDQLVIDIVNMIRIQFIPDRHRLAFC